nr:flagellar basal-body MS-ring/collar protein FliF [Hansschlegelia zhihuaiae]
MGVVTLALVGFFAFVIVRFTAPTMVPLFSDLSLQDSAAVVKELESQNVPYELRQDGAGILVSKDDVARLRMRLAEQRLPAGGGVGWEIFDKGDGFSSTSFVQNVNHLRALEGEIARSIKSLDRVASARVHLVVPERPLFTRDAPQPSASIVIRARGELGQGEVRAIRHLVASAVQGLKPEKVSLVDEGGRLLADGAESEDQAGALGEERTVALEKRLRERVEAIVGRVVGADRARVEVRAEIDRMRSTQTSDTFDPESRVARSTQTREENSQSSEPADPGVSVANQLPNANQPPAGAQGPKEAANKNEEVVNYEISRVTRTETQDGGRVKRLSVAVLVDGVYSRAQNGDMAYAPRPQEELDRIGALVRAGVGFDQSRGDTVEIVNLRFADLPGATAGDAGQDSWFDVSRADIMRAVELGVLALLSLLVLLFVVRPLMRKALGVDAPASSALVAGADPAGGVDGADGESIGEGAATASGQRVLQHVEVEPIVIGADGVGRKLAVAQVAGKIKAESVEKIGDLVRNNPLESANLIRQWMQDPA